MITKNDISTLVGNHVAPYIYNSNVFKPGETPIYYSGPYWDNREPEAAINALLNGAWITAGENVNKFENKFGEKFHSDYNLMVNSGSSANLVMLAALKKRFEWCDGDEVIVSPVGFATTVSVIYQNRLTPVFADIEWDTLNFDLDKVEEAITGLTVAIFVSPVLGNPPDMNRLLKMCEKHDVKLIVDACDSLGSTWGDRYLSEYGVASSVSFYPAHHLSCGEGGMISTNDKELHDLMVSIAWWGRDCSCSGAGNLSGKGVCGKRFDKWLKNYDGIVDHKYIFSNMGYNLKPLDLQGAIGLVQLDKFDEMERRRKQSRKTITKIMLENVRGLSTVTTYDEADVSWFGSPFICESKELKDKLVAHLEANKIQTRHYFAGNILLHPGFEFLGDYTKYPEANKVLEKVLFIGSAPHYTEAVFKYIEDVIKKL